VKRKKMNMTKKIAVVLAVMMVAAAMAAPAAMGDEVGYEAVVCTHQNTFICCGPDGDFGEILQGGTSDIIGTFGLKNVGGWDATVDAAFTTVLGATFGLVRDDNGAVIAASEFKLQQTGDKSTAVAGPCCSLVQAGDSDIGTAVVAFAAAEKHAENVAVDGLYDCGEYIYDAAGAAVAAGDQRLTDVFAACACVDSEGCCPGGVLTALLDNGVDVPIPGIVPRNGACCCCYDAKLSVPLATAAGTYLGTVQLTFANA
jgi:hypothetical protein